MTTDRTTNITFSKAAIEEGNISIYIPALDRLIADENAFLYHQNCVRFLVAGYEEDTRRMEAIPEVSAFIKSLGRSWPYLLTFSSPKVEDFGWIFRILYAADSQPGIPLRSQLAESSYREFFNTTVKQTNHMAASLGAAESAQFYRKQAKMILSLGEYIRFPN